ncbi:MAG: SDR family NAD(P)-dependent oxidoreductase [Rhodospirillaceae bacterium]|mgnify:CR=1 FL=1|jgi:NAD(P)-dependent dehydrogenase (short-subunit alcohol dehydrogenase family)|nr:SDR family NAD(P)-dependent oxidoreductase [Rhodospirillaceae bacterium]MBT5244240.1 SDR family NAD(P)-dependent oxidoreductase [Rhodospirillaceae bacterium]MBT5561765.1 SDR family NAD(P)-dependent oxidoreductase [Rhodospirillaceae bacterium]MBT6243204.1 SDR family NAD(P)-dependent oxidoreductase [Rhodospirillaceae bacterium]MBT7136876.1 SDR family NAD(P)-dependent oxidoreductase [Rhodospirillaceae bacterium]
MNEGRLQGRIALVTGASRGIGRAVAKAFAEEGAHLILTARTQGALEELDDEILDISGQNATLVPMDLGDFDAIDHMGAAVFDRFKRLDVLVGNAALLTPLSPMAQVKPKDWDQVLTLNLTANFRLLRSFDPLLRMSDAGRAIFVSSTVTQGVWPYWGAYSVSKAGLETMVKTYASENEKTNVKANIINPGPTRTTMRPVAYPGEDPETVKPPEDVTETFIKLAETRCDLNGEIVQIEPPRQPDTVD